MNCNIHSGPRGAFRHSLVSPFKARGLLHVAAARRHVSVRAGVLSATGQRFAAEHVTVKGNMGEGSYGQVFEVCGLNCPCLAFATPAQGQQAADRRTLPGAPSGSAAAERRT